MPRFTQKTSNRNTQADNAPETLRQGRFEQAFRHIDDVLWKEAGCTTELDYTEQTSGLLFLKFLTPVEGSPTERGRV